MLNGLNVNTPSANCCGNGKSLGFSDGTTNMGVCRGNIYYSTSSINIFSNAFNQNIGTSGKNSGASGNDGITVGITRNTNGSSGIITVATTSTISNYQSARGIIKY